jgi:hypothetical protein
MILIEFVSLLVVCAVLGNPLLTMLGYLPKSEEPQRHLWIGRFAPIPFVLLALDNAFASSYPQAMASIIAAVILFFIRNYFSEEKRIQGEYARWFVFVSAIYWASSLSGSGYVAAVLFVIIGFFLPGFFKLVAASSEDEENLLITADEDYSLASVPAPASVSAPPIRRFSRDDMGPAPEPELAPASAPSPKSASAAPGPTSSTADIGSQPAFKPSPSVAPSAASTPGVGTTPISAAAPTPRKRVIKPIDILAAVAEPLSADEVPQLGINDERKSGPMTPEENSTAPATSSRPEPAPTEREPVHEVSPTGDVVRDEPLERADDSRQAPPENDLSNFKLPTLPPRTAMPKPFSSTIDPDSLETEQPKPRTSGVSFRMDDN